MLIDGLAIAGYRSFGATIQRLCPLGKINLIIGENNSGKSNVLRFISKHLGHLVQNSGDGFDASIDFHKSSAPEITLGLGKRIDDTEVEEMRARLVPSHRPLFSKFIRSQPIAHETKCVWRHRKYTLSPQSIADDDAEVAKGIAQNMGRNLQLWEHLAPRLESYLGRRVGENLESVVSSLCCFPQTPPDVVCIPAIREITAGDAEQWFGGTGLVQRLAELERPHHDEQEKKQQFQAIQGFLANVLDNESVRLEITHDMTEINVEVDGRILPLTSLGTGIHEVIIMAAAATIFNDQIVCIEEPEIHLHPILQRKFVRYLAENTTNQYFIATHSAQLIDSSLECLEAFRVDLRDGESVVSHISRPAEHWQICRDLGYRSSDLVQANCVIWVEGPSDRVYLNHWLHSLDESLIEGIHYSIMFYGGRLLSHLTPLDHEVTEFISLASINRNMAIVIDSDKDKPRKRINATKARVRDELVQVGGIVWVTDGREVENYIPHDLMKECAEKVKKGSAKQIKSGRFDKVLPKKFDKVRLAHEVASRPADLSTPGLRTKVNALLRFIKKCN